MSELLSQQNPLMQWTRHPEIYIKLPSNGNFVLPGDYELSSNGELGIAPMTTQDELYLKTPEALLNGESIARLITSCAPGVKNVYDIPAPDIDAILLAIRLTSYGDEMDFDATCPKCKKTNTYSASLRYALENITFLENSYFVQLHNKVTVYVKPFTFRDSIKAELQKYHEAQAMKLLANEDLEDEAKAQKYAESIRKIATLMVELCANSVTRIIDPNGKELNASRDNILEWIKLLPRADAERITSKINEINNIGVCKKSQITCQNKECGHTWEATLSFDPSHFFV